VSSLAIFSLWMLMLPSVRRLRFKIRTTWLAHVNAALLPLTISQFIDYSFARTKACTGPCRPVLSTLINGRLKNTWLLLSL
jgi:hypothetical protein